jgi:hypothetical protein
MIKSTRIAPPNSLLFLSGPDGGQAPYPIRDVFVLSTSTCISVRCLPEVDGETNVVLGPANDVDPGGALAFDGMLETPEKKIILTTVEGQMVLATDVRNLYTRVRVWLSHPKWPEKITIGLD